MVRNQKVYITVGLPGSGKSTWAEYKAKEDSNVKIVSKDKLREMVAGFYRFDKVHEDVINDLSFECLRILLEHGFGVIVDECHITKKDRLAVCSFLKKNFRSVGVIFVYFPMDPRKALLQRLREPKGQASYVWQFVINHMALAFELPVKGENKFVTDVLVVSGSGWVWNV